MKRILQIIAFLLVMAGLYFLGGRGPVRPVDSGEGYAYQVIDDEGNVVKLKAKPHRIMTTHFHLDNLVLGVVPQERMIAVSKTMLDPTVSYVTADEVSQPEKVPQVTLEKVVALKPDLIISRSSYGKDKLQCFRDLGIPVYISEMPGDVEEIKEKITGIAAVTGEEESGKRLNEKIDATLQKIEEAIPGERQFTKSCALVSKMNQEYGGKGSTFDDLCAQAKIRNAVADIGIMNGQTISEETILKANPDYLVLSESWEIKHGNGDTYKDEFYDHPAFQCLKAVQQHQVIYLKDKHIYASNQNCVWAIRRLANMAYGNIFPEEKKFF